MSARQKVPRSKARAAARAAAEAELNWATTEKDIDVLAELLAHHAGIEIEEDT